jgi:hypothetical protein
MTDKASKIQIKETPKICAIDLDQEIIQALQDRGLQCFSGTFLRSKYPILRKGRI